MIRKAYKSMRKYWRIYLLTVVCIVSILVIFSPAIPGVSVGQTDTGITESPTFVEENTGIQFSIELGGGTRIRAPLSGVTAEQVDVEFDSKSEFEDFVSSRVEDIETTDVTIIDASNGNFTVEIASNNVNKSQISEILDEREASYGQIRRGVSQETRSQAVSTLQSRIDSAGLSGGTVRQVELRDGSKYVLVEVPNLDRQETIDLITSRGEVRVSAYYYNETKESYVNETVLTKEDFRTIGNPTEDGQQGPRVPVTLGSTSAEEFEDQTVRTGVAGLGGTTCTFNTSPNTTEPCLLTVVDGEVIYAAGMAPSLAQDISSGEWSKDPNFVLQTGSFEEAQDLSVNLRSGGLPAPLDIETGDVSFVSPDQGERFRLIAFIIGIVATLSVATSVSLRYGKLKIAAPMMLTAFSEVLILIAIAVAIQYPVDVAVIAGFIAVIGTGVDDLIIIADRVMGGENPASSTRVFDSRFKKALIIILSAAATTILALGPLALLDLRGLRGFAIFTIIGVIVGVTITRPAYGDMLRYIFAND